MRKLFAFLFFALAAARPSFRQSDTGAQWPLSEISLDLDEKRLLQFDETSEPVWMTELDKMGAKAQGKNFIDITDTQGLGASSQPLYQISGISLDLDEKRLLQFDETSDPVWMTELDKIEAKAQGKNFMDITDAQDLGASSRLSRLGSVSYPTPNGTEAVRAILNSLSTHGPRAILKEFTSFRTRYYRSETGQQSQKWLLSRIVEITEKFAAAEVRDSISISEFPHEWGQHSIVARINGTTNSDSVVIIAAHQDSTNLIPFFSAPGADDDGSGSVTILEAYRGLISAGFRPNRTVEFHWYSAEEGGLLGSQAVAKDYETGSVDVYAMIQFDMTAWVKKGTREEAGIISDFTDPDLSKFLEQLVTEYLRIPPVLTKCGYACSDHASWGKAGYRSTAAFEGAFENQNNNIHSSQDRIDISPEFSFEHILEFAKLAAAFAIELGGGKK